MVYAVTEQSAPSATVSPAVLRSQQVDKSIISWIQLWIWFPFHAVKAEHK